MLVMLESNVSVQDDSVSTSISEELFTPALQGAALINSQIKDGTKGVQVKEVLKDSPAAAVGLQKGDVIIGLNRERIQTLAQLRKLLEEKPAIIALNIARGDANIFLLLR